MQVIILQQQYQTIAVITVECCKTDNRHRHIFMLRVRGFRGSTVRLVGFGFKFLAWTQRFFWWFFRFLVFGPKP